MIRSIALSVLVLVSAPAFASDVLLPFHAVGLLPLEASLAGVETKLPKCPPNAMCAPSAIAKIQFSLSCGAKLGPVFVSPVRDVETGIVELTVTAYEIFTQESLAMDCFRAPIGEVRVPYAMGYADKSMVTVSTAKPRGLVGNTVNLSRHDVSLRAIEGRVVSVETQIPNCPAGALCEAVGVATIGFPVSCNGKLGPVAYDLSYDSSAQKFNLVVNALEINNGRNLPCARIVRETQVEINLGMGFFTEADVNVSFNTNILKGIVR